MPIATQIEAIVGQLTGAPVFKYGSANELNVWLDKQTAWPVVLLYPLAPITPGYTLSNAIDNKFSIALKFLLKSTFDQYTSQNEAFVNQAFLLANEFMVKLANYRATNGGRYFKVHQKDKGSITVLYNDFDANLSGVKLTMPVDTMYNDNVPLPPFP